MDLPKADDLRALLAAARDCGVTKLRITPDGGIDAELTPLHPGVQMVEEINRGAPIEDPVDVIRRDAAARTKQPVRDLLDMLANGTRLVDTGNPDPTAPV